MKGNGDMKHLFIVNPTAGGKDKSEYVRACAKEVFDVSGEEYEIYITKAPMDATEKIRSEASSCDKLRVYACGGDGTFNECVCGAAHLDNVAVAPFPTGTGNDFCRMFGSEGDLYRDLSALTQGSEYLIDLIDCNGRYSANICCVGIDARVGADVHKYSGIPLIGGATGYVVSVLVHIFKGLTRKMKIKCGDYNVDADMTLVAACNGRYYGGGFNPSIVARPDDGILDIYIIKKISLLTLVNLIGKYANGKADELTEYITHLRSDNISIEFEEDEVVNFDGEVMYTRKADLKLVPKALKLIVPKGITFFEE